VTARFRQEALMFDGSTPTSSPAPFAVGYDNGYGYGSGSGSAPDAVTMVAAAATPTPDPMATVAMPAVDLDLTRPLAPLAPAAAHPPYTARPVGAAHPRRRLGRGLVLGGLALLVAGTGIAAVAVASSGDLAPASASASASGRPAAATAASSVGSSLGQNVEPGDPANPGDVPPASVPVSIIVSPTVTRVPVPETVAPTTPPITAPTTTSPTPPPTTTPPTTAPPTTTPPTTMPTTTPAFTSISAPAAPDCPTPDSDAAVSFSWTATHTNKVTLSIDGPGVYRTYAGASGSETVTFPCSTAHTYLFTAHGSNGSVTTRSFTIAPS